MAQGTKRRGRVFIYLALILILVVVLIAVLLRNQLTGGVPGVQEPAAIPTQEPISMVEIVVAAQPIPRGALITEAVLQKIRYPQSELAPDVFFFDYQEVIGQLARIDIDARMPITRTMVVNSMEGSFDSFDIPRGMVAVSIPVNRLSSVSYAPQKGDHVNVIVTVLFVDIDNEFQSILPNLTGAVTGPGEANTETGAPPVITATIGAGTGPLGRALLDPTLNQPVYVIPSEGQRGRLVSQTLIQDAVVLRMGTFPLGPLTVTPTQTGQETAIEPTPTPVPTGGQPVEAPKPDVITIIVTPQDAVTLNYMIYSGAQLTLALRGVGDDQRVQTEAVTLQYVMDSYNIPIPAKLPYGTQPRLDVLNPIVLPNDKSVYVNPQ